MQTATEVNSGRQAYIIGNNEVANAYFRSAALSISGIAVKAASRDLQRPGNSPQLLDAAQDRPLLPSFFRATRSR